MIKIPKKSKPKEKVKPEKKKVEKTEKLDLKLIPEVNIGTAGHVDSGKTTLVKALTGFWADTHSEERKRGITIRLGYADVTFYYCKKCKTFSNVKKCIKCFSGCDLKRTVSFVDAPGHETLMATVLAGASLMDGALLLISANEKCPQPQTREHLTALDISGIKNIVIVQNKIDLVSKEQSLENYKQIKAFVKGTVAENAPIIPVSAQKNINMDVLIQTIEDVIKTPKKESAKTPKLLVARSFDINKPGTEIPNLSGGVLGGSIIQGELKVGDQIEVRPGIRKKDRYQSVKTKITGLHKAGKPLKKAGPGGLLGVSTELDPYLSKSDTLSGNVVGLVGKLPPVLDEIVLEVNLLEKVIGTKEEVKVEPIRVNENLMLTVGTARTVGVVLQPGKKSKLRLKLPICAEKGDRVAISRQVSGRWRLVGWGVLV